MANDLVPVRQRRRGVAADVVREGVRLTADRSFTDASRAEMAAPKCDGEHQHGSCDCGAPRVSFSPSRERERVNGLQGVYPSTMPASPNPSAAGEASGAGFVVSRTRLAGRLIALSEKRLEIEVALDATHDIVSDRVAVTQGD